ncbi:MAG: aldo/keto reductase [Candidatus Sumerlaeia bacterium]
MLTRKLGNSGIDASVVALGTWALGGWMWGGTEKNKPLDAVHAAIDHGITLIDTAPIYGYGHSEELVGKAISDRRDKVVLATKCGMRWDKEEGEFFFKSDETGSGKGDKQYKIYKNLKPESIRLEIERSLKRLNVETIDLYQTHWQDKTTPIEDTMAELEKIRDEGKIRAIGVSNATVAQMQKYGQIDSDQEKFSMLDRPMQKKGQLEFCRKNNIAVLAYSPLELGLLTGKVDADREFPDSDLRSKNPKFSIENRKKVLDMLDEFKPIAEEHNATIPQLVIAWTFSQPGCSHVLVGGRTPEQAAQNAEAGDIALTEDQLQTMTDTLNQYYPDA